MAFTPADRLDPDTLVRCPCCKREGRLGDFETLPCDVVRCKSCLAPVEIAPDEELRRKMFEELK